MEHVNKMPSASEIEEKVLGTFLYMPGTFELVCSKLNIDCFTSFERKFIYKACKDLYLENKPIDISTVAHYVSKEQKNISFAYIANLTSKTTGAATLETEVLILVEKHFARQTILKANMAMQSIFEGEDVFNVLDSLQSGLNEFLGLIDTEDIKGLDFHIKEWEHKKIDFNNSLTGIETGFSELNSIIGGWQPTDLIILAGRPGMGKTSLLINLLVNAALKGSKCAFFSMEMSSEQVVQRMISYVSDINLTRIKYKNIYPDEISKYSLAYEKLFTLPIYIDDSSHLNVFKLKNKLNKLKREYGLDLIVVDYLQLMTGKEKHQNRADEVDYISRQLKAIAKEFKVPVIALCQLSRDVVKRGGSNRPQLSDLRESGGIEQNADIVIFINRQSYYGVMNDEFGNSTENKAELIIAKHRNGATKDIECGWIGELTKFYDLNAKPTESNLQPNQSFDENPF
jgi:replicative DNA helicase